MCSTDKKFKVIPIMSTRLLAFAILLCASLLSGCDRQSHHLALGTLERDRIVLKATAAELITHIPHPEGSQVKKGDLLVQLDDRRQRALVAQAAASLASMQANLDKLRNGARTEDVAAARSQVRGTQAQLLEAQKTFSRAQSLVAKKLAGAAELDAARAKRDAAQASLDQATEQLRLLTNGTREEDLQQAEAQTAQAQALLALEEYRLDELSIRATLDARLDHLPKHVGERTAIGEALATLLDGQAPYARIYVPETHRLTLRVGQSLVVHVDGLDQPLTGSLRWIAQEAAFTPYFALNSTDRARLMYLAEIQLPEEAVDLPSGLPVQVELPND